MPVLSCPYYRAYTDAPRDHLYQGLLQIISSIAKFLLALVLLVAFAIGVLWARSYLPDDIEAASVECSDDAPAWTTGSPLKVMSYNVQYMASKNYVFFYDINIDDPERLAAVEKAGKTIASYPSEEHVFWTLDEVAELIHRESPDVVMLQEINGGRDSRTHYTDHAAELMARLPAGMFTCQTAAPYWKAEFVFHPQVLGPVNMQLVTLSRYRISDSVRHQLPRKANNFLIRPFDFQRALLVSRMAGQGGRNVALINTHFDAWGAGTGIMEQQVTATLALLDELNREEVPWVLGGDLNLLPPDGNRQLERIHAARSGSYDLRPQIKPLYDAYRGIPSLERLLSEDPRAWYTHYPNDPSATGPDRTIDYQFYSRQWQLDDAYVMHGDALQISDHLPVVGVYSLSLPSRSSEAQSD